MILSCGCCCIDALSILIVFIISVIIYFKWSFTYWKRRNVPFFEGRIPYGSIGNFHRKPQPIQKDVEIMYRVMKARGEKHAGMYMLNNPVYLPIDPNLIKNILIKDFDHFVNRGVYYNKNRDPLSAHLFSLEDEKWKNLRTEIKPIFANDELKAMFEIVVKFGYNMKKTIDDNKEALNINELVECYITDILGYCVFGKDCNTNTNSIFRKFGKQAVHSTNAWRIHFLNFPKLAHNLGMKIIDNKVSQFFRNIVNDRDKNNTQNKNFMQLLINLKKEKNCLDEISAQTFLFFTSGLDTCSSTLTYCLYELSQNKELQDIARQEINKILAEHNGQITYEAINKMHFLEQCIKETLRKYPPVAMLQRICNKKYNVPDMNLTIEKGIKVFISTYGLHHDSEYYPEPYNFNPDRFADENKDNLVPYTFLPFGNGPRSCIGLKFGMLQVKIGLVHILADYKLRLSSKTPKRLSFIQDSNMMVYKETIYLETEKIIY